MDLTQMLEHMPPAKLESLKTGETIVVSSTKGIRNDQLTAIMVLANADLLIQMASRTSSSTRASGMNAGMSGGMGMGMGMGTGGSGGLDLGSMGFGGIVQ